MEILFICINYNTATQAISFVNSLIEMENKNLGKLSILIVDNSLRVDDLFIPLIDKWNKENSLQSKINIIYIHSSENLGYFGGANYGLHYFLKQSSLPKYVVVSNVDIHFTDRFFIEKLLYDQYDSDVGVIAPSVISTFTKLNLNPFFKVRPSYSYFRLREYIYKSPRLFFLYRKLSQLKKEKISRDNQKKVASEPVFSDQILSLQNIYAPHGSFIIFQDAYFNKGGTLDYPCFLFGEEFFVAETCRSLELSVLFNPSLQIFHKEHSSMNNQSIFRQSQWLSESTKYIKELMFFC
jgi:GT2 family glycosyltransferase